VGFSNRAFAFRLRSPGLTDESLDRSKASPSHPMRFLRRTVPPKQSRMHLRIRIAITHFLVRHGFTIAFVVPSLLMGFTGCQPASEVTTYDIPTNPPPEFAAEKTRMLAAMVPQGNQVWFFKVTGPLTAVDVVAPQFNRFIEKIQFKDGQPELNDLPTNWKLTSTKRAMRFASIDIETPQKQLDLSVSSLSRQDDYDAMVAMNVNRWRGQLGLQSSEEKWAASTAIQVPSADGPSVSVDLVGDQSESNSMTPPFAAAGGGGIGGGGIGGGGIGQGGLDGGGIGSPPTSQPMVASAEEGELVNSAKKSNTDDRLQYKTPDGWRAAPAGGMRLASFDVGPEDAKAVLTVIPAGGDLRGNVQRWIGQVRGEEPSAEIVDAALKEGTELTVSEKKSQRFFLPGKDDQQGEAIDATIVPLGDGFSLFIKMTGPVETVRLQSESIAQFLQSLRINL
jgi:hypothetical protein